MSDILSWNLAWLEDRPSLGGSVLATKVRLRRNLSHLPFPSRSSGGDLEALAEKITSGLRKNSPLPESLVLPVNHLGELQKGLLVECGLGEPSFFEGGPGRVFVYSETGADSLLLNYEDHLVVQVLLGGLGFIPAWEEARAVASGFEHLGFAFDQELGYLTASPKTVGTGLQASVLLNLPALEMTRQTKSLVRLCAQRGCLFQRYTGPGKNPLRSSLFVLSNGRTLGKREEEILEDLRGLVVDVVAREQRGVLKLREEGKISLEDKLWRSFGMMRYARYVDFEEALFHLSLLRMGMSFGSVPGMNQGDWKRLVLEVHPLHIRAWSAERGIAAGEHEVRAYRIRQALKGAERGKDCSENREEQV